MNRALRTWGVLLACLGMTVSAGADERGTTGADFLKIGLGARTAGMGEAAAARFGDVNAVFYNPAGLAGVDQNVISATHLNWIAETRYEALAYARPLVGVGTVGTSFFLLHMPDIPALDQNGRPVGAVSAYDMGVQFSYARDVSAWTGLPGLAAGANLKLLHRELAGLSASGAAADLGALYRADDQLTFGISCMNLGHLSSFDQAGERLPIILRGGTGCEIRLAPEHTVHALLDLVYPLDNTVRANMGLEYAFARIVHLRAGYKLGYDTDGFQAGAGVQWQNLSVDYALKLMDVFGLTHFVSASVGFGTSLQALQRVEVRKILGEAEALYGQSKYAEALTLAGKAVAVDPENRRALALRDKLKTVLQMLEMPEENQPPAEPATETPEGPLTPDEREEQGTQRPGEVEP